MVRWLWVAVLAAAVSTGGWLYAHGKLEIPEAAKSWLAQEGNARDRAEPVAPAPVVSVVKVGKAQFKATALVTGSLVPREEIVVAPEVAGQRIVALLADVGDEVAAGQTLARLATVNLEAQLAQVAASKARAVATGAQARSLIAQARAQKVEADAALARAAKLRTAGDVAESVYDQRLAAARTAEAQLASALQGLEVAEAEVAQVEARERELVWQRNRGEVTAPAGGIISQRAGQIGAMASASAMFQIIRDGEIELAAEVPAAGLGKVRVGQMVSIVSPDGGRLSGRVRLIAPRVDPVSRLGEVRIFIGKEPRLRIGTFVRGEIELARSFGLSIPASAVMYDAAGPHVLVVEDGRARRRNVVLGLQSGGRVEVSEGLSSGQLVIAKAGTFLRDGDAVKPVQGESTQLSDAK